MLVSTSSTFGSLCSYASQPQNVLLALGLQTALGISQYGLQKVLSAIQRTLIRSLGASLKKLFYCMQIVACKFFDWYSDLSTKPTKIQIICSS